MSNQTSSKNRGTFNLLENVGPNLFRHQTNDTYYGVKKSNGKRKLHCLETTERKTAERKLVEWLKELSEADPEAADLTLAGLFVRARSLMNGTEATTKQNELCLRLFERTFERGMSTPVNKVRPTDLASWIGKNCGHFRNRSYNEYRRILARVFRIAVIDRVIPAPGPFTKELVPKKKKQEVVRNIPTAEQFDEIIAEMRRLAKFNHPHSHAADFTEFMGIVGVGQAEASTVLIEDIGQTQIHFHRVKTDKPFYIPIFAKTRAFLDRWLEKLRAEGKTEGTLFNIQDSDAAFKRAVGNLGLPNFSPRNLRSMRIVAWLDSGVDVKQVAEWQGHSDGGKLILDTYSNVVRSNREAYLSEQIARAEGKIVRFKKAA